MLALIPPVVTWLTPYSVTDMLESSVLISQQSDWKWTIVRAPTLHDPSPVGDRICKISEITSAHVLSRKDYAACMLDSLENPEHYRRDGVGQLETREHLASRGVIADGNRA